METVEPPPASPAPSDEEPSGKSLFDKFKSALGFRGAPDTTEELEHEIQELLEEGEEQGLIRVNIDEVISVKEVPYVGVEARIFLCRGTVDGRQRQFALKYLIRAHCWCLMDRVC